MRQSHQFLAFIILTFFSCTTTQPTYTPNAQYRASGVQTEVITKSLFSSKDQTISEEDIQRLLNGSIDIPDSLKIAVFRYGGTSVNRYYSAYWSNEEYLKNQQSYIATIVDKLEEAHKVQEVVVVPTLMADQNPSITQLREAAVRLQADMLLVFTVNSDIYYQYKTFKKNEAKAFATCEALLLDTRTGLIPHSNIITRENLVEKTGEDISNQETKKRAEEGAITSALTAVSEQLTNFLDNN